jgi:hypothetical protein
MLIWFTDEYGKSIAVDNRHVTTITEILYDTKTITNINTLNGSVRVTQPILQVVSSLNSN